MSFCVCGAFEKELPLKNTGHDSPVDGWSREKLNGLYVHHIVMKSGQREFKFDYPFSENVDQLLQVIFLKALRHLLKSNPKDAEKISQDIRTKKITFHQICTRQKEIIGVIPVFKNDHEMGLPKAYIYSNKGLCFPVDLKQPNISQIFIREFSDDIIGYKLNKAHCEKFKIKHKMHGVSASRVDRAKSILHQLQQSQELSV